MFILIFILLFHSTNINVYALENQSYYARVMFEQVYLFKSPIDDNSQSNIYFEIPRTYFVELLDKHGEFYEAKYLNIVGYVKKDSVQAVLGKPNNPYLSNITFRVYAELSESLWSEPSTKSTSTKLVQIPKLTKNILYLGKLNGECLISGRTDIWFYCKYTEENIDYYGYVYSDFCDEISPITNNNENLTYINNPSFETEYEKPKTIPENSSFVGLIIGILSIPAIIFILMILKSGKILNQNKIKRKEIIDY